MYLFSNGIKVIINRAHDLKICYNNSFSISFHAKDQYCDSILINSLYLKRAILQCSTMNILFAKHFINKDKETSWPYGRSYKTHFP